MEFTALKDPEYGQDAAFEMRYTSLWVGSASLPGSIGIATAPPECEYGGPPPTAREVIGLLELALDAFEDEQSPNCPWPRFG